MDKNFLPSHNTFGKRVYSILFIGATLPCGKPPAHLARGQGRIEPRTSRVQGQHANHYIAGVEILIY